MSNPSFKHKRKSEESRGFTLLEVILVMFIVSFVFTGIYSVLAKNSQHEKDNRYVIIASNLAQEGVEIIRNRRDENLLSEIAMNSDLTARTCFPYWNGTTPECTTARREEVELVSGIYRNCPTGGCGSGETTFGLERSCVIGPSNTEAIEVTCTVTWRSPSLGIQKEVEVSSYLTNWQENN